MRSAVLLLTAGADSHTVTMARRLLAVRALDELKMMGENCGIDLTHLYGRNTIAMDEVRRYFDA